MFETDVMLGLLAVSLLAGAAFALAARMLGKRVGPSFFGGAAAALTALVGLLRRRK